MLLPRLLEPELLGPTSEQPVAHSIPSRSIWKNLIVQSSVGPVPETSVPIRFRVLQFEDRFDSGSYLTSRPRFRVGSGRVIGSSICIFDTIFKGVLPILRKFSK